MNKIKYTIASLLIVGTLVQCDALVGDPDLPIPLEETMANTGAFLRVLSVTSSGFDVADLNTAKYEFLGEIQDVNNGQDVDKVDFYVAYKASGQQAGSEPSSPIASYNAANFTTQEASGLPGSIFSLKLVDILSYLNLDVGVLALGDQMEIRWEVILKDGTVFTNTDASPAVTGGFYVSPYFARASVVQSIPENIFIGEYTLTQTSNGATFNPLFGNNITIDLILDDSNKLNGRVVNVEHLPQFGLGAFFDLNLTFFRFQDFQSFEASDNYVTLSQREEGPLACSAIGLYFDPIIDAELSGFDVNDDSSFNMTLIDNPFGDCGGSKAQVTFTAVKN
jgi:hypothetical protein